LNSALIDLHLPQTLQELKFILLSVYERAHANLPEAERENVRVESFTAFALVKVGRSVR